MDWFFLHIYTSIYTLLIEHVESATHASHLRFVHQLRLLLSAIMGSKDGLVVAFGLICSTFIAMSRGSTFRSYFLPEGDLTSKSVRASNCLAARNGQGLRYNLYVCCSLAMLRKSSNRWTPLCNTKGTISNAWVRKSLKNKNWRSWLYSSWVLWPRLCRTVLAMLLVQAKQGVWLLEQPSSSLVFRLKRFRELLMKTVAPQLQIESICSQNDSTW